MLTPSSRCRRRDRGAGHRDPASRADAEAFIAPLADAETTHCVRRTCLLARARRQPGYRSAATRSSRMASSGCAASSPRRTARRWSADELRGNPQDDETIGRLLAQMLRDKGADPILEKLACAS